MYDTWHWANQMMLMLIWHTVLLIVSGQRYKRQMLQKCPHCDSIVAICHAYGLRTVDISVTRLKWLQGKMQSLVAFSAEKKHQHAADFLKRRDWRIWYWIFEGLKGLVIAVEESTRQVVFFCQKFAAVFLVLGAENRLAEVARLGRHILTNIRCTVPARHLYG